MEEKNDYSKLPDVYEAVCSDPEVIVLGCHHLNDSLCPGTCCLAKQELGRLESAAKTESILD